MDACESCSVCITHMKRFDTSMLSRMMAAPRHVDWYTLCADPQEWMLPLMIKNPGEIWWPALFDKPCCYTSSPGIRHNLHRWMLPLLMTIEDPNQIDWQTLHLPFHFRPWMLPLMHKHHDELNWNYICVEPWMKPLNPPQTRREPLYAIRKSINSFDQCRCKCTLP